MAPLHQRRVLLLSPLADLDPATGDVTYTERLLACPPPGVVYVSYQDALAEGSIVERYRRGSPRLARGERIRFAREAVVNRARMRGVLFREPFRHFWVDDDAFDLIHTHVFSVGLGASTTPLVVSNGVPVDALYTDGLGGSKLPARARRAFDTKLASYTNVTHSSYDQAGAAAVVCWSEHLRDCFVRRGGDPSRYWVVSPAVDVPDHPAPARTLGIRPMIGFIGHYEAKGGATVLAAHERLRADGLDVALKLSAATAP